ncbi:MAG: thiamine diphosphokinase [Acidobacteriota bacterium]|nr:thiamine diphosphokinase [Acidobacteriota bacterium]
MAPPRAVLVANAPLRWTPRLTALAAGAHPLLAADGGANHLARIGLRPAAVIGDLDSITESTRSWLGEEPIIERRDQDRTDLDKGLEYAFEELGVKNLTVLAATGGRVDHDLGNLGLLARLALGTRLVFEGDAHRLLAIRGEDRLESIPGETWSFWAYDPNTSVTVGGVRWPINNAAIDAGNRPSISNEAVAETVRISATGGSVVVYREVFTRD